MCLRNIHFGIRDTFVPVSFSSFYFCLSSTTMGLRACQSTTRVLLARNLSWQAATAVDRLLGKKYSEKNSPYSTSAGKESEKVAGRTVVTERRGSVVTVAINRPEVRNAVNQETAGRLLDELTAFDSDPALTVAVLHGNGGNFCAGYDLKELAHHTASLKLEQDVTKGPAPMGPSRLVLSKPLIAAVSGYAVAGGLELALLADLRVVEESAVMGVFCRRFGVPLIDGGTVRLPRLIGLSRALDLILTGRPIGAQEALAFGLANRVVPDGQVLQAALELAEQISTFPQQCMRADRSSAIYSAYDAPSFSLAMQYEMDHGAPIIQAESVAGATRFSSGTGRGGKLSSKR